MLFATALKDGVTGPDWTGKTYEYKKDEQRMIKEDQRGYYDKHSDCFVIYSFNKIGGFTDPQSANPDIKAPAGADLNGGIYDAAGKAIPVGGSQSRPTTYFTLAAFGDADRRQTNATSTPVVVTSVTDMNSCTPYRVVRRTGRFRVCFGNGTGATGVDAIRIKGTVEVPVKNGTGTLIIPLQFNSQDTVDMAAGAGRLLYSDWITYPLAPNDLIVVKGFYVSPVGGAFNAMCSTVGSGGTSNPAGAFSSGRVNTGVDSTAVPYLTGTWSSANFASVFSPLGVETDLFLENQVTTVDVWGDSIIAGTATTYIHRLLKALNIPYANLGISGSSQVYIPSTALARMNVARGDIAFCNHGHNATSSLTQLSSLWTTLRQLGYKKIIQTLITEDFSSTDSFATTNNQTRLTDATAINNHIRANLGVGDGPDAIWDIPSIAQPGRAWVPLWTSDGIHPNSTGESGIDAAIRAAGWQSDLTV